MNFNQDNYYRNELALAESILLKKPNDSTQISRAVYAAAWLGQFDLAETYASSEKDRFIIDKFKKKNG